MKAESLKLLMNEQLADFARWDCEANGCGSMNEHRGNLIRKRRQAQIYPDVAFLERAMEGAPMGDPSDEEMADIVAAQHRHRVKRKNCLALKSSTGATPQ